VNSTFENNIALNHGGAIIYNSYDPYLENNTYINNSASYGQNVFSYAVKVMQIRNGELNDLTVFRNIASGIILENPITLAIVDVEGNILTSDSSSYIKILEIDTTTEVTGENTVSLVNGTATFTQTVFNASPGKENVSFRIFSSAINYDMVEFLDSIEGGTQQITINFRWCKPGEIISGNVCSRCNAGTYSVLWNATECFSCPDHASCEAEMISLSKGYWRIDGNSTDIIECPNEDACLGGYFPENENPVDCKTGYKGLV
jgi:hypothetical protein